MKKFLTCFLSVALAAVMAFGVAGCGDAGNKSDEAPVDDTPKEYVIQYTDDSGTHQINVTDGMPYSLEAVPARNGYTFAGLFDAEVGGTQYVSASGASLSPFTDKKNMVLFPQFKAKEYTLFLDYQGAPVTGNREYNVNYGERLPELPKNVSLEHNEFIGWFTQAQNQGNQVADKYGLLAKTSYINETNFDLSEEFIYLYAGFETEKHTVTFCFDAGMDTEEVAVPYNTPVSDIIPETRVNGNAVLTWSKTQGGEVFNGKVTDDMVLYAVEYAPVIELDTNGGNQIKSVVARAGSTVALPTPTKDLAKFAYWEDMQGNVYEETVMPEKSISLKAVWQAKLVFDENGGSDIDDISVKAGEAINLPTPEKDGFIFAGWYTADKTQYTATKMPAEGVLLKAGWYAEKEALIIFISGDNKLQFDRRNTSSPMYESLILNLSQYLPADFNGIVKLDAQFKASCEGASLSNVEAIELCFYSTSTVSESFKLWAQTFNINSSSYTDFGYSFSAKLTGNTLYGAIRSVSRWYGDSYYLSDYRINLTYPDTTNLYL